MANAFKNGTNNAISSSFTDLVTCPSGTGDTCVILSIMFCNSGSSGYTIGCRIVDSNNTVQVTIADGMSITGESALELCPNKFILTEGQKIQVNSNSTAVNVIVSYMEST